MQDLRLDIVVADGCRRAGAVTNRWRDRAGAVDTRTLN